MIQKKKIEEYNIVRVIAVLLVIISHCEYYKITTNYGEINYSSAGVLNITFIDELTRKILTFFKNFLYTFHMPLFFALSGALFKNSLNNGKVNSFKELIIQKSERLLIPFIIIVLLFSTPIKYLSGYFSNSQNILKDIIVGQILLQGNNYLWFLPTLFFEFLVIYLIKEKINYKKCKTIFLIFFILMNIASPIIKITIIKNIFCYLIYFYIGYLFEDYRTEINQKIDKMNLINIIIKIIIITILLTIFNVYDFNENISSKILKYTLKLFMAVLGTYMIYLISYKLSKTKISNNSIIRKINENSFGIYLYSDPLNYLILYIVYNIFGINVFYTNPGIILIFLTRLLITFFVSFAITSLLRKKKVKYIC